MFTRPRGGGRLRLVALIVNEFYGVRTFWVVVPKPDNKRPITPARGRPELSGDTPRSILSQPDDSMRE